MLMSAKATKDMTINYTDFDINRLTFTELTDNDRSKGQKICYPRYDHPQLGPDSPLCIQLPWITLDSYGVPRLGEYYSDDSQRAFIKTPLKQTDPEVKIFCDNVLKAIDNELKSDEFKNKIFGIKASKYIDQSSFRLPQEDDDDKPKDPKKKDYGPKQPYTKLKIDTSYPDNKVKTIIFNSVMEGTKRVRTKVEGVESVDEFAKHVCFMSRIRPIIRMVKFWAQAPNKKDPTYGVTFKILKMEVEPPVRLTSNFKQYLESDKFLDSDDESDGETKSVPPKVVASTKVATQESSDSESDDPKPSAKAATTKGKQVAQVDSDDSESEDAKPVAKGKATSASESDDDSDEESEEIKPAKKAPVKAATKATSKPRR